MHRGGGGPLRPPLNGLLMPHNEPSYGIIGAMVVVMNVTGQALILDLMFETKLRRHNVFAPCAEEVPFLVSSL